MCGSFKSISTRFLAFQLCLVATLRPCCVEQEVVVSVSVSVSDFVRSVRSETNTALVSKFLGELANACTTVT